MVDSHFWPGVTSGGHDLDQIGAACDLFPDSFYEFLWPVAAETKVGAMASSNRQRMPRADHSWSLDLSVIDILTELNIKIEDAAEITDICNS